MENGVENGLLPDSDQLGARENQMGSSTDGEGEGEGDSTPQPQQTTNDDVSDGEVDGERDLSVSDAAEAEAEAEADAEVAPAENVPPCRISILEDSLCEKDVDSDVPDDENDDEVRIVNLNFWPHNILFELL